jgi:hypothetical protein
MLFLVKIPGKQEGVRIITGVTQEVLVDSYHQASASPRGVLIF